MWHASISLQHRAAGPLPVDRLSRPTRTKLIHFGRRLLRGVGEREEHVEWEPGGVAIHVRRPLTQEEIAGLPVEWLANPAVDLA